MGQREDIAFSAAVGAGKKHGNTKLTVSSSSATTSEPLPAYSVLRVVSNVDCRVCFSSDGDDADSETDELYIANVEKPVVLNELPKYVSVLKENADDDDGELNICEVCSLEGEDE